MQGTEFKDKLVSINRITKVVKGGRRFAFSALVVVGNFAGSIGVGYAKAKQVPDAIKKATQTGGPIRAACEVVGIKDVVAKSLGSSNPINVLRACIKGLRNQNSPKHIANIRGKKIAEITKQKQ